MADDRIAIAGSDNSAKKMHRMASIRVACLGALAILVAAIVGTTVAQLSANRRTFESNILPAAEAQAVFASSAVSKFIDDIEIAMQTTAQGAVAARQDLNVGEVELLSLARLAPGIVSAVVTDAEGLMIAGVAEADAIDPDERTDYSATVAFQRALAGQIYRSDIYFVRESEPHITISLPVVRLEQEFMGALITEISLRRMSAILRDLEIEDGGLAYVVTSEGELIAHPNLSAVLRRQSLIDLEQVQQAIAGLGPVFADVRGLGGTPVVAAYAPIPSLGWFVIVERPRGTCNCSTIGGSLSDACPIIYSASSASRRCFLGVSSDPSTDRRCISGGCRCKKRQLRPED